MSASVVLVRPLYPRNIGQCARAMANMGIEKLIIIGPRPQLDDLEVREGAARAQLPLQNARAYSDWDEFYENEKEGLRIAFSRRDGKLRQVSPWKGYLQKKSAELNTDRPLYLIFGPEDVGLSFEDLNRAHHVCTLPTFGENQSFNLAQAVLIALYIYRDIVPTQNTLADSLENGSRRDEAEDKHFFPEEVIRNWIQELGFDIENRKVSAFTVLRKLLLKNEPSPKELRILEVVIHQTVRKLREKR